MLSPTRSPYSRTPNSIKQTLSPAKSPFQRTSTTSMNQPISQTSTRNIHNEPHLDYANQVVHVRQKLLSLTSLKIDPKTKILDIEHNSITDFRGLPSLQHLLKLNVADNPIESLLNLPPLPMLREIKIDNTPFSGQEYYRIALILACPSLHKIDGQLVTNAERRISKEFHPDCVNLLRAGWVMKYPPPKPDQIPSMKRKLAKSLIKKAPKKNDDNPPKAIFRSSIKQSVMLNKQIKFQEEEIEKLWKDINILAAQYEESNVQAQK